MPSLLFNLQHLVMHRRHGARFALSLCCFDIMVGPTANKSEHSLCSNLTAVWHLHVSCSHAGFAC